MSTGSAPGLTKISLDAVLKELVAAEWRTEDNFQVADLTTTLTLSNQPIFKEHAF